MGALGESRDDAALSQQCERVVELRAKRCPRDGNAYQAKEYAWFLSRGFEQLV